MIRETDTYIHTTPRLVERRKGTNMRKGEGATQNPSARWPGATGGKKTRPLLVIGLVNFGLLSQ